MPRPPAPIPPKPALGRLLSPAAMAAALEAALAAAARSLVAPGFWKARKAARTWQRSPLKQLEDILLSGHFPTVLAPLLDTEAFQVLSLCAPSEGEQPILTLIRYLLMIRGIHLVKLKYCPDTTPYPTDKQQLPNLLTPSVKFAPIA
eukprot:931841-Pelagomonas_calceolata.AAC.1